MIGLDTNVIVRYILQDAPAQAGTLTKNRLSHDNLARMFHEFTR